MMEYLLNTEVTGKVELDIDQSDKLEDRQTGI